jgi:hypothetical protein
MRPMQKTVLQLRNVFESFGITTDRLQMFAQSPVPSNERLWRLVQPFAWWGIRLQLETQEIERPMAAKERWWRLPNEFITENSPYAV